MKKIAFLLFVFDALLVSAQSIGKSYALFVVVTEYDHWTWLPGTDSIPRNIAYELENNYGFEKVDFKLNPTKEELVTALTSYQQKKFEKNDQFFVYFSMHGHYDKAVGAIIPKNGRLSDPAYETWIIHPALEAYLTKIPCEHILFALDACYSGTFGPKERGIPGGEDFVPGEDCLSKIDYLMKIRSRLFVTSGRGAIRVPTDSNFAQKWQDALRVRNTDGIMNFHELASVLVEAYPKPYPEEFLGHSGGGDFLFIRKNACSGNSVKIDPDLQDWQFAQSKNTIEAYESYLEAHPKGKYRRVVEQSLARLREDIFWQNTRNTGTVEACKIYLEKYPNGRYRLEAEACIEKKVDDTESQMVFIAGGAFQMGCDSTDDSDCLPNESPVRTIVLSPYYLSKHEVTFGQFKSFVDATGYKTEIERRGDAATIWVGTKWENKVGVNWRCDELGRPREPKDSNHPVLYVSWQDANEYCKWIGQKTGLHYRLPTEAEWEYAAGNGFKHTKYAWGNDPASWQKVANLADESAHVKYPGGWSVISGYEDGFVFTAPVGSFPPNELELYDMDGNVREWCGDRYAPKHNLSESLTDPKGPSVGGERVVKGGSWYFDLRYTRNTYRSNVGPLTYDFQIGFRLARSKAQPEKARRHLKVEKMPTIDLLQEALFDFKFNGLPEDNPAEAIRMLQWIGVDPISIKNMGFADHCQVWGTLPTGLEVRIWTKTYEPGCYGLRFQREDLKSYIIVNYTYLPICEKK